MPDIRDTLNACSRLLGREAPARGPVLDLHLIAKEQGAGPVVEVSTSQRMAVDKPDDGHAVQAWVNDSM